MPKIQVGKMRVAPGFPKQLMCLGRCGKVRTSMNPGDRKCHACRSNTPRLTRVEEVSVARTEG